MISVVADFRLLLKQADIFQPFRTCQEGLGSVTNDACFQKQSVLTDTDDGTTNPTKTRGTRISRYR